MDLQIYRKNLELNDTTRDYIARKVGRLSRHLSGITVAKVEISRAEHPGAGPESGGPDYPGHKRHSAQR